MQVLRRGHSAGATVRRLGWLAVLPALPMLAGCDVQASLVIFDDRTVTVDAVVWDQLPPASTSAASPRGAGWCDSLAQGVPGVAGQALTDPSDANRVGCRLAGNTTIDKLRTDWWGQGVVPSKGQLYFGLPANQVRDWVAFSDGVDRPAALDLAVTFPGAVTYTDASATVEGTTVHWRDAAAAKGLGFQAVAYADPGLSPAWWAVVVAGGGVLAAAGVTVAWFLRRRSGHEPQDGPDAAASDRVTGDPSVDAAGQEPGVWGPDEHR